MSGAKTRAETVRSTLCIAAQGIAKDGRVWRWQQRPFLLAATMILALAATPPGSSAAESAVQVTPTREDLERASAAAREAMRRVGNATAAPMPRLPDAPNGIVDVEAMARRFQSAVDGTTEDGRLAGGLLVFVSFSMPPASLRLLAEQAARAGGTLVLRGLHQGSLQATAAKVREALGDGAEGLIVDPRLFDLYRIDSVPVFVVAGDEGPAGCAGESCAAAPPHARLAGDVTLEFALRRMAEASDSPRPYLDRLRRGARSQ